MPSDYPHTAVPYDGWALPDLHDPVVLGPGFGSIEDSAAAYARMAEALETAAGDLRAVMARSQAAHDGEAAEASRRHIRRVAAAGDGGVAQAKLAQYALQEQASYYFRARMDMQAAAQATAAVAPVNAGEAIMDAHHTRFRTDLDAARIIAVDGAKLYQTNSNHNLDNGFQAFPPPAESPVDASAAPAPGHAGGSVSAGAGVNGLGPTAVGAAGANGSTPAVGGGAATTTGALPTGPNPAVGGSLPSGGSLPGGTPVVPTPRAPGVDSSNNASTRPQHGPGDGTGRTPVRPGSTVPPWAGPAVTNPQSGRPLPGLRDGVTSHGPSTASGWVAGQPWTTRPGGPDPLAGGYAGSGGRSLPGPLPGPLAGPLPGPDARPDAGRPAAPGAGATASGYPRTGHHVPMMPMGGAGGRGQETTHTRPPWLVEDDPESIWLSGLPPHGPAVIE